MHACCETALKTPFGAISRGYTLRGVTDGVGDADGGDPLGGKEVTEQGIEMHDAKPTTAWPASASCCKRRSAATLPVSVPMCKTFLITIIAVLAVGCASLPDHDRLPEPTSDRLLFVVHGAGSSGDAWPADLLRTVRSREPSSLQWDLVAYDWEEEALKVLTAPRRGYRIGEALAADLIDAEANRASYRVVHIVAHSVGSHVAQGLIDSLRQAEAATAMEPALVFVTFVDPFVPRGVLQWRWGESRFGAGADAAECYISVEDGVPGTNRYLRLAHNYDVTALVPQPYRENASNFHWWPVEYYRSTVGTGRPGYRFSPLLDGGLDVAVERVASRTQEPGAVTVLRPDP